MNNETGTSTQRASWSSMREAHLVGFLVGVACFVVACGSEPVRDYNRIRVAPFAGNLQHKQYGTVKVFQAPDDVKRPYEVIGLMSCEASAGDEAAILNAMLYRAADMGADGILLNAPRFGGEDVDNHKVDIGVSSVGWNALIGGGNSRAYRSQAIRFKE